MLSDATANGKRYFSACEDRAEGGRHKEEKAINEKNFPCSLRTWLYDV